MGDEPTALVQPWVTGGWGLLPCVDAPHTSQLVVLFGARQQMSPSLLFQSQSLQLASFGPKPLRWADAGNPAYGAT